MSNQQLGTNTFGVAKWIVSATASDGTHTTIQAAINAASSGDTIFIRPGTYTENLTLKAGVDLTAFVCNSRAKTVSIVGKCSSNVVGTISMSGISFQTNGDYCIEVTNATLLILNNCYFFLTNANGIHQTTVSSTILIYNCQGDCGTNTYFISTIGGIKCFFCNLGSQNTTTASTFASSDSSLEHCHFAFPITTSGTGSISLDFCVMLVTNTTAVTAGGSGSSIITHSRIEAGTGSAISVGAGAILPVILTNINCSNANAITGAGTLKYAFIAFDGSSSTVNTNTVTPLATLI